MTVGELKKALEGAPDDAVITGVAASSRVGRPGRHMSAETLISPLAHRSEWEAMSLTIEYRVGGEGR